MRFQVQILYAQVSCCVYKCIWNKEIFRLNINVVILYVDRQLKNVDY